MTKSSQELLQIVIAAADDKLAQEIVALDVRNLTPMADYFVIAHARNEKQMEAIVDEIEKVVEENGYTVKSIEGKDSGRWILVDLTDVIVHIFYYSERGFYNLEKLWSDAPIVNVASEAK
ncbi:ribosome silencing factor [Granulicatella seriolae]|uniref:Ribosomal silencing factor RsfS n=1 Tax=Granulicatella seriolae TaxID=2967226 RepID=A0ABT1WNH7_9LACT|nr:ribosome silencing factor [Granulicatella seriolae]